MLAGQGGMLITQNIAHLLLSRLKEFTEWSQCLVLQLLTRYRPSNEEEIFDILVCCILTVVLEKCIF